MKRRIGIVVHHDREHADEVAVRFTTLLEREGLEPVRVAPDGIPPDLDAVIGVGGDGTVLRAAAVAIETDLPLAGINVGRVGYLAEFETDEVDVLAEALAADNLLEVERSTLEVAVGRHRGTAVNDVVVEKVISQRIVQIGVTIDGEPFATYRADGVIVATPLGSTAYSLSAGGPVLDPSLRALVLTPVAPHSLLSRSLVLDPRAVVHLAVELDRPARVNVDGRELTVVAPGDVVEVRQGSRSVRFLTLGRHPFPQAVRHQFGLDHA